MKPTLEEVTKLALELDDKERLQLAEDLVASVTPSEEWVNAWAAEADRRYRRMESGEDRGLTIEEFFSDEDD